MTWSASGIIQRFQLTCGADHALRGPNGRVWMVNDEAWAKVPKKYQRKILCQRCFTNLTGLDPEDPSIKRLTRG